MVHAETMIKIRAGLEIKCHVQKAILIQFGDKLMEQKNLWSCNNAANSLQGKVAEFDHVNTRESKGHR